MLKFKKKRLSSNEEQVSLFYYWWVLVLIWARKNIFKRFQEFKARRPHRSFRLTRRRDAIRPLNIAGHWSFTRGVLKFIFINKDKFFSLIFLAMFFSTILIGLMDRNFITSLQTVVDTSGSGTFEGFWGEIGKAGLIMASTFSSGGLVQSPSDYQKITIAIISLLIWLAVVQICRNILSGRKNFTLRDALYSCGAPIVPTAVISVVILIQMIPVFIATIIGASAKLVNLFVSSGIEQMAFFGAMFLLISLSIFWVMGSLFAMIIVTIPGTYPFRALKIAGDMVSMRRLAIFRRVVFLFFILALVWSFTVIPIILITNWLRTLSDLFTYIPIIQISMLFMTMFSLVFSSTYIYMLYRKIVDADRKS